MAISGDIIIVGAYGGGGLGNNRGAAYVCRWEYLPPEITVAPGSLAFGAQDVDAGPALSQTVTITNDGSADLHVPSISLTGGDAAHFQIESGGSPVTLTQGSTRTVQVSFDPSTTGAKSANLTIQSDGSDEGMVNVALSGTGEPHYIYLPLVLRNN